MDIITTYEKMLENHKNPCFIVDFDTNNILCCNTVMEKLLAGKAEVIGKPFYQLIHDAETPIPILNWAEESLIEHRIFDEDLHKSFDLTYMTLQENREKLLFIEYKIVESPSEKPIFMEVARRVFLSKIDEESKIVMLLDLLGEAYKGDCSYVHLVNHDEKTIKLKYSWLKHSITDTTHYLVQDVEDIAGFEGLMLWAKKRNDKGIWDCDENRDDSPQQAIDKLALAVFNRKNLILCGFDDKESRLLGAVSIGDCETLNVNHSLLKYVTTLITSLLSQK